MRSQVRILSPRQKIHARLVNRLNNSFPSCEEGFDSPTSLPKMELYSIWIIPPEPFYSKIEKTVNFLSKKYKGPVFEPHMTLLGNIEMPLSQLVQKTKKLAESTKPFVISSGPVSFSTTYFQSVLLRINSNAKLMQLNLNAKKLTGKENDVFMPHISLLYGDHEMGVRQSVASEIRFPKTSFLAEKFTITPSTKDPSEWKHVAEIPFG